MHSVYKVTPSFVCLSSLCTTLYKVLQQVVCAIVHLCIAYILQNKLVADVSYEHAGIVVRFMNGTVEGNGIRDPLSANNLIQQVCT